LNGGFREFCGDRGGRSVDHFVRARSFERGEKLFGARGLPFHVRRRVEAGREFQDALREVLAANAQLLQHFPKGFTLGGVHAPHITMLQRFVKTADLPKVYATADRVIAKANPTSFKLTAYKYDHIGEAKMGNEIVGVGNILVKPTPDLLKLQQELADAIKPFEAPTGTSAAFVTTPQAPHISEDLIQYVSVFVPDHSGAHYVPHVSIGVGTIDFLTTFSSAPFDDFTFSPAGASVYHLGEYGTAMKKLHSVPLKQ